jgi:hypothetical protein
MNISLIKRLKLKPLISKGLVISGVFYLSSGFHYASCGDEISRVSREHNYYESSPAYDFCIEKILTRTPLGIGLLAAGLALRKWNNKTKFNYQDTPKYRRMEFD